MRDRGEWRETERMRRIEDEIFKQMMKVGREYLREGTRDRERKEGEGGWEGGEKTTWNSLYFSF